MDEFIMSIECHVRDDSNVDSISQEKALLAILARRGFSVGPLITH